MSINLDPPEDPPHGTPVPQSDRAEVRGGIHVDPPHATDEDFHRFTQDEMDVDRAIHTARNLVRVSRNPTADATWPSVESALSNAAAILIDRLHGLENDPANRYRLDLAVCKLAIIDRLRRGRRA